MPTPSFELTRLDTNSFEHLANMLCLKVLGAGHTGFGPGSDGGRDGYFEGQAPYPSLTNQWDGTWYIQSKFLAPRLSADPQKWLLERIKEELGEFQKPGSRRSWPTNLIIITNIDASGVPQTGCFDKARAMVKSMNPELAKRFAIWGGRKILDLLALHNDVSKYYMEFITAGQVLAQLHSNLLAQFATISDLTRYLIVTQFEEQQFTRLEQAGSDSDSRPGIHHLFVDLPYRNNLTVDDQASEIRGMAAADLVRASARDQRCILTPSDSIEWQQWERVPHRARVWFVKGGPGQGKSTLSQYYCQIQRAALMLGADNYRILPKTRTLAKEIQRIARNVNFWPAIPRIPISIELKDYAHWFGNIDESQPRGVLTFLAKRFTAKIGSEVLPAILRNALGLGRWAVIFDGLDEVPSDVKDEIAKEITYFVNDVLIDINTDALIVCTSRPQGYSGQFSALDPAQANLSPLTATQALACAKPVLAIGRSSEEAERSFDLLKEALTSPAIGEIMQSPLQAHIMAVVVRDGERPPERKWNLFSHFYKTIKRREANRNLPDRKLAKLLREGDKILQAVHNRLGFELHSQAETSEGATSSLSREEFRNIIKDVVSDLQEIDVDETVEVLWGATTERLVLVSTPENTEGVRFDVRQFQEFFAAEFIADPRENNNLLYRLSIVADDSHWREVVHFLISGLIEKDRWQDLAVAIQSLIEVDQGGGYQQDINLGQTLAIGARVAGKLLQEGALEADRKIRSQFRNVLLPLIGSTDSWMFLTQVNSPQTQGWLEDMLTDEIQKQRGPGNIGAALALALSYSIRASSVIILCNEIKNANPTYQGCFL